MTALDPLIKMSSINGNMFCQGQADIGWVDSIKITVHVKVQPLAELGVGQLVGEAKVVKDWLPSLKGFSDMV